MKIDVKHTQYYFCQGKILNLSSPSFEKLSAKGQQNGSFIVCILPYVYHCLAGSFGLSYYVIILYCWSIRANHSS